MLFFLPNDKMFVGYPLKSSLVIAIWMSLFVLGAKTVIAQFVEADDGLKFQLHVVDSNAIFSSCGVMDVDKDGDQDIVSGAWWYEAPSWKRHFVGEVEIIRGRPDGYSHLEMDVNRDGWTDLVHVNFRSASIYWLEHPGSSLGEWTKHVVEVPGPMETGRLYDVDGDGQMDVVPSAWDFAAWYELLPGTDGQWARYEIDSAGAGHGSGFGDVNGDGRGDFVGTKGWAEGPTDPRMGKWTWHAEFDLGRTSMPIIVGDIDGDGDADLLYSIGHDYGTYWLEQESSGVGRTWIKHLIDSSWSQGHSPLWVDLDEDAINEFVNGKRYWAHEGRDPGAKGPLVIYRYEFDRVSRKFNRYIIQSNGPAGIGLDPKASDLDGDGDIDLVFPGRSGLYWYENLLRE